MRKNAHATTFILRKIINVLDFSNDRLNITKITKMIGCESTNIVRNGLIFLIKYNIVKKDRTKYTATYYLNSNFDRLQELS